MRNGRCQLHGGKSTGPRTPEGIERIRRAVTKHGRYSQAAKAEKPPPVAPAKVTYGEGDSTREDNNA
jgi:hypothetical protein